MVQWLGFAPFTRAAEVRFLVGEKIILFTDTMAEWSKAVDSSSTTLWCAQVRTLLVSIINACIT